MVKDWKIVNFKLSEQMSKRNNQHVTSVGQKKSESLTITHNLPNTGWGALSTELLKNLMESKALY